MRDSGILEQVNRGLYRLSDLPPLGNPDLVQVALKAPKGVICLISSLAFYGITTQVPHEVYLALEQKRAKKPILKHPPLRVFWLSGNAFSEGIETHRIDGVTVRFYGPEKTVADCFKYRNKIGLDVAIEALRLYLQKKRSHIDSLMHFASVCRVETVMRPYMEAML
jgi:predicted transcriptional regulator of viral defense system